MSVLKELIKEGAQLVAEIKLRRFILKISIALVLIIVLVTSCKYLNKAFGMKDDNFLEEAVEDMIEVKTGIDIDLTPASEENKNQ